MILTKIRSIKKFNYHDIGKIIWTIIRFLLLLWLGFFIIYPLIIRGISAFKSTSDIIDPTVFMIPKNPTFRNILDVFNFIEYPKTLINTILFSFTNAIFQTFSCALVAYGIARFKFKGRNLLFAVIIITLIIPQQNVLFPMYVQMKSFSFLNIFSIVPQSGGVSLINTYGPFVIMSVTALGFKNGLFIYMLRQHFINMPVVLEEAAYLDGCSILKTFIRIMLPSSIPMLITVFLFSFVWQWNDYFFTAFFGPSMDILSAKLPVLAGKISFSKGLGGNLLYGNIVNNVGVFLLISPLIVLYVFAQKFFVQGIERSGIVG